MWVFFLMRSLCPSPPPAMSCRMLYCIFPPFDVLSHNVSLSLFSLLRPFCVHVCGSQGRSIGPACRPCDINGLSASLSACLPGMYVSLRADLVAA